ncbi:DcuS/MalK family sensor histidine kinase [Garciella nitratireducens]|uniref:DcuS/MalK family sensor histidine kinase n=1 Tax=Garciella nitratireducens TaxID=218205 RepID=UPI001BD21008|nr:DcuS/MalK family sensor histidine kinase [Garciella nitratireducens]
MKLSIRIIFLVMCVILLSLSVVSILIGYWNVNNIHEEEEYRIMDIANIIANMEDIRTSLTHKDSEGEIQKIVEKIITSTKYIEVVVIADMEGIRYGHPSFEKVGKKFVGGDEKRVVQRGESYISEATGTLGRELRAFVPIYNFENQQIGFVMVGTFTESIKIAKNQALITVILSSFIGLFIGVLGAFLLASNIKKILLGLEPEEISKLYIEKKSMLDAIHEGIISIDEYGKITLINDSAIKMLKIEDKEVNGKDVMEIIPTSHLPEVLKSGVAEYNQEQNINGIIVVTNRVPMINNGKIIGAIASFRDKTQLIQLAEKITGVKQIVEALRANTHEFRNRLHVILGLLQLGEYDTAKEYITKESEKQQQIVNVIIKKIKNPTIAALILGKINRAKELGVHIIIAEKSELTDCSQYINNHVLVIIIGNLIENAMDAISQSSKQEKLINLFIYEDTKELIIEVEDNGIGIAKENLPLIFNRSFTLKKDQGRGIGLSLVKNAVESLNGIIEVQSEVNEYTRFHISIPKEEV